MLNVSAQIKRRTIELKSGNVIVAVIISVFLAGCANPLNRVTSDRYSKICSESEREGNMSVAAEACYRAYINVEWGNLGPEQRSEKLYNFGRVIRRAGRYEHAKEALVRALVEEEKLSGKASKKTGRRLAELAATYYKLENLNEGTILVDRLIPLSSMYTESEKKFIAALLLDYALKIGDKQIEKAASYISKVKYLGYSKEYFEKQR